MEMTLTAQKTFFWYRVYLGAMALLYLVLAIVGIGLLAVPFESREYERGQIVMVGGFYAAFGAIFFIAFAIALFLPPKPYNWIVGIVLIALGLTSCCLLPATIPLLIYWVKPETQAFFGRRRSP